MTELESRRTNSTAESDQQHNVVANRAGAVLIKNTLLKSDHFPGASVLPQ